MRKTNRTAILAFCALVAAGLLLAPAATATNAPNPDDHADLPDVTTTSAVMEPRPIPCHAEADPGADAEGDDLDAWVEYFASCDFSDEP